MKTTWALALALSALEANADPQASGEIEQLGFSRFLVNDALGDGKDRWQTGSYVMSIVKGPKNASLHHKDPGRIWEFRVSASIISPSSLSSQGEPDRPYVTTIGIGARNHFDVGSIDGFIGVDLYAIGPQTHLDQFHADFHEILGIRPPLGIENQLANDFYPTLILEVGDAIELGPSATLRPFLEAQIGIESLVRAGLDVTLNTSGNVDLWLRERVTGQRYVGAGMESGSSFALTLGADIARVLDSAFFPSGGPTMEGTRNRVRVGMFWTEQDTVIGIGLSTLSPEFVGQAGRQVVGSVQIQFQF
jgi:Uncharacterized protein conserved in bacteria (DUF2219)